MPHQRHRYYLVLHQSSTMVASNSCWPSRPLPPPTTINNTASWHFRLFVRHHRHYHPPPPPPHRHQHLIKPSSSVSMFLKSERIQTLPSPSNYKQYCSLAFPTFCPRHHTNHDHHCNHHDHDGYNHHDHPPCLISLSIINIWPLLGYGRAPTTSFPLLGNQNHPIKMLENLTNNLNFL